MELYIPQHLKQQQTAYKLELCLLAIATVVIQDFYFLVNGLNPNAYYLHTALDHAISLVEWFAIPYIWYYFYLIGSLAWLAFHNTTGYYQLLFARIAGIIVCLAIYTIFPTATIRPEVIGDGMLGDLVRLIYTLDKDYNCLPSTHALDTLLTTLFLLKYTQGKYERRMTLKALSLIRILSYISLILIYLSTLFLKQHVLADLVAATVLGVILYAIFRKQTFGVLQATLRVFYQ